MLIRLIVALLSTAAGLFAATREPVHARRAMVVTSEANATRAGLDALRRGGNAVDAAIAVGFTLAVTHPNAGNLGGGGFMLIRFAGGGSTFLDFREMAPAAAGRDMYLDAAGKVTEASVVGYRAAGVPGTVRGFELAHEKYGSAPWDSLVQPAIELAGRGFEVTHGIAESLRASGHLARFPESNRIFLNRGRFYGMGDILRQRDLRRTLRRIAEHGASDFYEGKTARLIAADMERNGGLITIDDLKAYKAVERPPIQSRYGEYEILGAPPPSSGGVGVAQMLNMLDGSGYEKTGAGSAAAIHYAAEAMRRFFADRAEHFGDADFVNVPVKSLISPKYARDRRATIDPGRATKSAEIRAGEPAGYESGETTHYSVVDASGNAVSVTYTLNGSYGSGVTAAGTGVLLNNEMDDFTAKPGAPNMYGLRQSDKNAIEPGKRPLSAMSPTIVTRGGKLYLVLGSPGGPTIINTVLQVVSGVIDFKMDLQQAVDFPRFHHQWLPDELRMEAHGFSPDTIELLEQRGHKINFADSMGRVMAIQAGEGWLLGAADSRSEGTAGGY